jgi:hypothetical protein
MRQMIAAAVSRAISLSSRKRDCPAMAGSALSARLGQGSGKTFFEAFRGLWLV